MTTTMDSSSPTLYAQVDHRSTNHLPPLFKLGMQTTTFPPADPQRKRNFLEYRRSSMDNHYGGSNQGSSSGCGHATATGPSQGWTAATSQHQHQQQPHWATVSRGSSAGSEMDLDLDHSIDQSMDHSMDDSTMNDPSLSKATSYHHQQAVMAAYYRQQQSAIMSNDQNNNGRTTAAPQTTKRRRRASLLDELSPMTRGSIAAGGVTSNSSGGYGRHNGSSGPRDAGRRHQRSSFPRAA